MKRYRTSLCCRSGMSYRMARTLSRIAKPGEKAVARSHCAQNRNILFKCPRWSRTGFDRSRLDKVSKKTAPVKSTEASAWMESADTYRV